MGGDDLDDLDFLDPVRESAEEQLASKLNKEQANEKKRKRNVGNKDDNDDDSVVDEIPTKKSSAKVLIESGRELENQTAEVQAAFLWTTMTHYLQMQGESVDGLRKPAPNHFVTSSESTLQTRLKSAVSMKKLKKWKPIGSPMVVILCLSARRAVAVLKDLASFKIRAAKLFAKHMEIEQQKEMIENEAFGLAVATPNRLKILSEPEEKGGKAPIYFGKTQLVLLDSHVNQKGFTVCTLPDTAPDTMSLLAKKILPQLKQRKDIKIAFF